MNRELGIPIHHSNLKIGHKFVYKSRAGEAVVEVLSLPWNGTQVEILEGAFRPLGKPRLVKGDVFTVPDGNGQFYEIAG